MIWWLSGIWNFGGIGRDWGVGRLRILFDEKRPDGFEEEGALEGGERFALGIST
jgi:hypothetical protein